MKPLFTIETVRLSPRLFFFIGSGIIYADTHLPAPFCIRPAVTAGSPRCWEA